MGRVTVTQTPQLQEGKGVFDKVRAGGAHQRPFLSIFIVCLV